MKWRLIDLSEYNAYWNMAIDEAILKARIKKLVPNTFRIYRWNPSAVSIGRNQGMEHEVDIENCEKLNIGYVRRISGGGAVYHDYNGEITYSIVASQSEISQDIDESFIVLCKGIINTLGKFGLNAAHGKFHCPSIFVGERKISGNAQARRKGIILQHGTILLDYNPELMYTVLKVRKKQMKTRLVKSVYQKVTTVKNEIDNLPNISEFKNKLIKGYEKALKTELKPGKLTSNEMKVAKKLVEKKYSTKSWNFKY
ncbi:MAG: lipoate--protein ligase family protein [Candidatus Lokiarchaeota archaeon]|nr:lipoate--protein ligase family protein [Candidatus Lokiarchaeota archaeon]